LTFATRLAASSKIKCNIPKGGAVNVAGLPLEMGEEDGSCSHCRALSLPRGDACRSRSAKPWKSRTARDGHWHTEPNRAMPWKADVCLAATLCPNARRLFRRFRGLAAQPPQFRALLLCGRLSGKSGQHHHRKGYRMRPHPGTSLNDCHAVRSHVFISSTAKHG
jgi:hypothetical protein